MTFQDLQNLALSWLDDPNAGYFTPAVLNPFLNNAQKEVQKKLLMAGQNWYLKCAQTTLVVNQGVYLLPQDFRQMHRVVCVTGGTYPTESITLVAPITLNQQDYTPTQVGMPESYMIRKNSLQLLPVPDTPYILRIYYSYMVADMVNAQDVPDVPQQYHEYIAVLATLDGALKDHTDMSGVIAKKQYYEDMLRSDMNLRTADMPRMVVVTEDDGFGKMW